MGFLPDATLYGVQGIRAGPDLDPMVKADPQGRHRYVFEFVGDDLDAVGEIAHVLRRFKPPNVLMVRHLARR